LLSALKLSEENKVGILTGYTYLFVPPLFELLFVIGLGVLFNRARSPYTGLLFLGFLLPLLMSPVAGLTLLAMRSGAPLLLLSLLFGVMKVVGLFGYIHSLRPVPAQP
jgi:hypothetical protein